MPSCNMTQPSLVTVSLFSSPVFLEYALDITHMASWLHEPSHYSRVVRPKTKSYFAQVEIFSSGNFAQVEMNKG